MGVADTHIELAPNITLGIWELPFVVFGGLLAVLAYSYVFKGPKNRPIMLLVFVAGVLVAFKIYGGF